MEKWNKLLIKANQYKYQSELLLDKAAKELMRSKGFSEKQVELFNACFDGGHETIITFNQQGEDNDMGLENFCTMTKEEIIEWMEKFLDKKSISILKNEKVNQIDKNI